MINVNFFQSIPGGKLSVSTAIVDDTTHLILLTHQDSGHHSLFNPSFYKI